MHVFSQNVCEDKSRRTIAKSEFPFIDNRQLEQCQNKRITMGKPDGFIEIEVGEASFDVLKALLARPFDWISAASREVFFLSFCGNNVRLVKISQVKNTQVSPPEVHFKCTWKVQCETNFYENIYLLDSHKVN